MMQVRLARSIAELKAAYRLLHDAYVACGFQEADPWFFRLLPHYLLPTSHAFVVLEGREITGTATLVAPGVLGLPLATDYQEDFRSLPPSVHRPVEVSGLALRTGDPLAKFALFRTLYEYSCFELDATDLLITVRAAHARFYSRSLLFERAGPVRPCSQVMNTLGILMRLDLTGIEERFRIAHPSGLIARHLAPDAHKEFRPEESLDAWRARQGLSREVLSEGDAGPAARWRPDALDVLRRSASGEGVRTAPSTLLQEALP